MAPRLARTPTRELSDKVKNDYRITVRLSGELRQRLKDAAIEVAHGSPKSFEKQSSSSSRPKTTKSLAYERAKKAGLIGVVHGACRDLRTNPKHLDGFGDW